MDVGVENWRMWGWRTGRCGGGGATGGCGGGGATGGCGGGELADVGAEKLEDVG